MHIIKVLDPLEKLETKISELYEWFSRIFADDAEAASRRHQEVEVKEKGSLAATP